MASVCFLDSFLDAFCKDTSFAFDNLFLSETKKSFNFYSPDKFTFKIDFLPTNKETRAEWFLIYNQPFQNVNYFGFEFSFENLITVLSATPWWSFFLMYMPYFFALLWVIGFFVINFISMERSRIICLVFLSALSFLLLCFSFYAALITPKLRILDFYSVDDMIYLNGRLNANPLYSKLLVPDYENKQSAALLNYLSKDVRFDEILNVKTDSAQTPVRHQRLFTSLYGLNLPHLELDAYNIYNTFNTTLTGFNQKDLRTCSLFTNDVKTTLFEINSAQHSKLGSYPQNLSENYKTSSLLDSDKRKYIVRAWYSNIGVYSVASKEHILPLLSGCCWSVLVSLLGCIGVSYKSNKDRLSLFTVLKNKLKSSMKRKFYYKLKMREIYYVHGGAGCMEWRALEKLPKQKKIKHIFEDLSSFSFKNLYKLFTSAVYTRAPYLNVLVCLIAAAAVLPLNSPATSLFFVSILLFYFLIKTKYPFWLGAAKNLTFVKCFRFLYRTFKNAKESAFNSNLKTTSFAVSEVFINSLVDYGRLKDHLMRDWKSKIKYVAAWIVCVVPASWCFVLNRDGFNLLSYAFFIKILLIFYILIFLFCFVRSELTLVSKWQNTDKLGLSFTRLGVLVLFYILMSFLLFTVFYGLIYVSKLITDYGVVRVQRSWFVLLCLGWIAVFFNKYLPFNMALRKLYVFLLLFLYTYTIGDLQYTVYAAVLFTAAIVATRVHAAWCKYKFDVCRADGLLLFDSLAVSVLTLTPFFVCFMYLTGGFYGFEPSLRFIVNTILASLAISALLCFGLLFGKDWSFFKPLLIVLPFGLSSWLLCCVFNSFTVYVPGTFCRVNYMLGHGWVLHLWLWSCLFLWRIVKYCKHSELLAAFVLVFYPYVLNMWCNWHALFVFTSADWATWTLFLFEIFAITKYLFFQFTLNNTNKSVFSSIRHIRVDSVRIFSFLLAILCFSFLSLFFCLGLLKYTTLYTIGVITICCMYSSLLLCIVVLTDLNRSGSFADLQGSFAGFRYLLKLFYISMLFLFIFICLILCNFL